MTMKSTLSMILLLAAVTMLPAQESPVLLTIADEHITLEEFERIYRKNNNETSLNRQSPGEYLELFINFKLKVKEAESLGMDTTQKFINELEGYRQQLAKPYLSDNETREEMMREAYERAKVDINASHILIRLQEGATPEDTLAAHQKISEIRQRIIGGGDFETVARATSDDASVSRNGGNLGYFTVFSMVYPFETVAYNTPAGEVSQPFRTSFGYHILQVHDRRPARGQVKVAHIFIRTPEDMGEQEKEEAFEKAHLIHDSLQMGADFAQMARVHSEDPSSARNGGEMPWFGTGRMIPEFEDACFALENRGDISKPFKSFYGWHIVELLDKKGVESFEEMKPDLQEKVNRGDRVKYRNEKFIAGLMKEYGFEEFPGALEPLHAAADSSLLQGKWEAGPLGRDETPLLRIGDHTATAGEFAQFIQQSQARGRARDAKTYVNELYGQFRQDVVMDYEDSRLAEKYPEFRYIYEEYHDGILLFDIMDKNVWSKAVTDSAGLAAFHKAHRNDYMWKQRADALLVTCGEGCDLEGLRKASKKIMRGRLDEDQLNEKFCTVDTVPCITLTELLVEPGENELVDAMEQEPGIGPVNTDSDATGSYIILRGIRSPEPKELDDARGQITSDYQNFLEQKWIEQLREKYPVEVNRSLLAKITS